MQPRVFRLQNPLFEHCVTHTDVQSEVQYCETVYSCGLRSWRSKWEKYPPICELVKWSNTQLPHTVLVEWQPNSWGFTPLLYHGHRPHLYLAPVHPVKGVFTFQKCSSCDIPDFEDGEMVELVRERDALRNRLRAAEDQLQALQPDLQNRWDHHYLYGG